MKFFVVIAAFMAVAVANPLNKPASSDLGQLEAIIAAINSPSTDPATAQLLEEQLAQIITENVSVGPAIVDFPIPDPSEVIPVVPIKPEFPVQPIQPSPVVVGPIPEGSPAPLVQIIVNVNQAADSGVMPVAPVVVPEYIPADPVIVVDNAPTPVDPVIIVEPEVVDPINVVESVPVSPVIVVDPIIPTPVVTIPETLN